MEASFQSVQLQPIARGISRLCSRWIHSEFLRRLPESANWQSSVRNSKLTGNSIHWYLQIVSCIIVAMQTIPPRAISYLQLAGEYPARPPRKTRSDGAGVRLHVSKGLTVGANLVGSKTDIRGSKPFKGTGENWRINRWIRFAKSSPVYLNSSTPYGHLLR